MEFTRENLNNIKDIFQAETGVQLKRKKTSHTVRLVVVFAALLACMGLNALGGGMFDSENGDKLAINAEYMGDGIIHVHIENKSDNTLEFQELLQLKRAYAQDDMEQKGQLKFQNTKFRPHSSGTMIIDVSDAYDLEELEEPLVMEWYRMYVTNNNFEYGHYWGTDIHFSEMIEVVPSPKPEVKPDDVILDGIAAEFMEYFSSDTVDIMGRVHHTQNYMQAYERYFAAFDGEIVKSVIPEPNILIGRDEEQMFSSTLNYHTMDAHFKLVGTRDENALVLGAVMPDMFSPNGGSGVPLFYIMTYPTAEVKEDSYAFIRGRLISFGDLEKNKVFSDDKYTCFEVSEYFWSDLVSHASFCVDSTTRFDEETLAELQDFYEYFKENLPHLLYYRDS